MKWFIPAKTFFLGEYAAIEGAPAIILTTEPCFELTLTDEPNLLGIHPDSPAGRFWAQQGHVNHGLSWHDPYGGCGGLGASSAQWLGAYYASLHLQNKPFSRDDMLERYFESAWQGIGMRPSGYDVLAQSLHGCVYIHREQAQCNTYAWPFPDLAFILLHTGKKLATHHHLQSLTLTGKIQQLANIVESAKNAFESADSERIIDAVNAYHQALCEQNLVANHSLQLIDSLKNNSAILTIKGCGALGADVLLLLVPAKQLMSMRKYLLKRGLNVLATSEDLYFSRLNKRQRSRSARDNETNHELFCDRVVDLKKDKHQTMP